MGKILVIDPGHGGKDAGAVANNLLEKDLNLAVSKGIQQELKTYDVKVLLTRETDVFLSLLARSEFSNSARADYFISIHTNAGGGTGYEDFIFTNPSAVSVEAQGVIHREVMSFLSQEGFRDRGKKRANFSVLRHTTAPCILLENLFIDNPYDAKWLAQPVNLVKLAKTIAAALVKALNLTPAVLPWIPANEIAELVKDGLLNTVRDPSTVVNWGELATLLNRIRKKQVATGAAWDPVAEQQLLVQDKLLSAVRQPLLGVYWGEFATVLNRLRNRRVTGHANWDPVLEINLLLQDQLINTNRQPMDPLLWGEFATVLNRFRAIHGRGGK
ncbi:N-acetylmuramoyl-L-alanine amidase [Desulforamulus hydrothermalis]|uniref:N-acetylmuramoyl-L-alanine amidase (Modular protein) n=1 Tax=Desulforamulus hydrothermalis Lam5 = DSM 18033 TaxID=1121428 RepID=K8DZK9_9FIRM|nr:N-acetylmuramoyl-L-alanine amidase [Desulforamulus hydrothermalis]CCO08552.1 N-acetylmuramoyl-L-alanine amidase (modular protein) [Desulforamulus hydrothermalis Lam5 = DSM 18033]SHH02351.1 N-acetylmuramoyl-L-alanine amidase [Desulforamulus hydrothermalis Lam5 = DSM 18033]